MNALSQLYPKSLTLMRRMRRVMDEKRRDVNREDWEEAMQEYEWDAEEPDRLDADLYHILVEKTEDEGS